VSPESYPDSSVLFYFSLQRCSWYCLVWTGFRFIIKLW